MNRAILAGSVIVGIAVIFSMSMMPANAEATENVCVKNPNTRLTNCQIPVVQGQHATVIVKGVPTGGCHYDIFSSIAAWGFLLDHGPERCANIVFIAKNTVSVPGP